MCFTGSACKSSRSMYIHLGVGVVNEAHVPPEHLSYRPNIVT